MPFLFHYIETSLFKNGFTFAFIGTLLYVVVTGLLTTKSKLFFIYLTNICTILLSIVLGAKVITPPNESWFNPFGMSFAIILTGMIILIGILIVRFITRIIYSKQKYRQ